MTRLHPVSRRELIKCLKQLGFEGPFSGGKHQYMIRGELVLRIPNPHKKDISVDLIKRILQQGMITREQWMKTMK